MECFSFHFSPEASYKFRNEKKNKLTVLASIEVAPETDLAVKAT